MVSRGKLSSACMNTNIALSTSPNRINIKRLHSTLRFDKRQSTERSTIAFKLDIIMIGLPKLVGSLAFLIDASLASPIVKRNGTRFDPAGFVVAAVRAAPP
jgi:hypothetical protein